jgi:hypothetical protein
MNLDETNQELLDVGVPISIFRVINDHIHSGHGDEETSFQSLTDVSNELKNIVHDWPKLLFYNDSKSSSHQARIEFGNIVYRREAEIQQIVDEAAQPNELLQNRLILISAGNSGEGKTHLIGGVKNDMVNGIGWISVGVKFDRLMHNSPLTPVSSCPPEFLCSNSAPVFQDSNQKNGTEHRTHSITQA